MIFNINCKASQNSFEVDGAGGCQISIRCTVHKRSVRWGDLCSVIDALTILLVFRFMIVLSGWKKKTNNYLNICICLIVILSRNFMISFYVLDFISTTIIILDCTTKYVRITIQSWSSHTTFGNADCYKHHEKISKDRLFWT